MVPSLKAIAGTSSSTPFTEPDRLTLIGPRRRVKPKTILETVHILGHATTEQIVRLHLSQGYPQDVQKHVIKLVRQEILEVDIPP